VSAWRKLAFGRDPREYAILSKDFIATLPAAVKTVFVERNSFRSRRGKRNEFRSTIARERKTALALTAFRKVTIEAGS
jgi:hypothetical protein